MGSRDSKTDTDNEKPNVSNKNEKNVQKGAKQKNKQSSDKHLKQNPLYLSSENTFGNYFLPEKSLFAVTDMSQVKMREALTRRCRRSKVHGQRVEELNSSSGNWSASSESGRTSASSENQIHQKPLLSDGSAQFKRKFVDSSTPSRNGSSDLSRNEGSPIVHRDMYDDENSSIYSCDTEGYFTSFHLDSGLKNMKNDPLNCEYGLFGKMPGKKDRDPETGSDDTLVHVDLDYELALFKEQIKNDSQLSANGLDTHLDYSNSPEFQLMDQESPIREKTLINSSRIPSMSEITPLNSDEDEQIVLEGLLQTLNCKPLQVLSSTRIETKDEFIKSKGKVVSQPIFENRNLKVPTRKTEKDAINFAGRLFKRNTQSKSFHDVSNLPPPSMSKKPTKYWTMPLLKKKPYLKSIKLFDEVDGGPSSLIIQKQLEKVPLNKLENIVPQKVQIHTLPVKKAPDMVAPPKPVPLPKPMKSFSPITSNNLKENIPQAKVESKIQPKIALMDFKKLLLSTAGKKTYERQSATELLKVTKEPQFPIPIQDMSYSPRALSNRRMIRQKHPSPVKKSNVMSPRSKWKYKNFGTNVITAIPEVSNEEENASHSSQDAVNSLPMESCHIDTVDVDETEAPEDCSLKTNIFLQEEENNFMRGEVKKYLPGKIIHNIQKSSYLETGGSLGIANIGVEGSGVTPVLVDEDFDDRKPTLETSF